jgi:hypothetical protein
MQRWADIVFVASALVSCATAHAQVHKCVSADGRVEFSNTPCRSSASGGQIRVVPNEVSNAGAREQALKAENQRLREQLSQQSTAQRQAAPTPAPGRTYADLQAERANTYECKIAQQNYETTASSSTNRDRDTTPERLKMYAACGMREPDQSNIIVVPERIINCNSSGCFGSNRTFFPASTCNSGGCTDRYGKYIKRR